MKRTVFLTAFLMILMLNSPASMARRAAASVAAPSQTVGVDVSIFYDNLAPYGRWFQLDEYGWVWMPYGVEAGWRPYTDGYWVFTDEGWLWVSSWDWGWAPFHYGRWLFHASYGWVWIPGTVWAPAWVAWRAGPGWIGWAPLPPAARWETGGLVFFNSDRVIEPYWYSFVDEHRFTERHLERVIEVPARNVSLLRNTQNITHYTFENNRVINRGIAVDEVERVTGKRIEQRRIVAGNLAAARGGNVHGNGVVMYRPRLEERIPMHTPASTHPEFGGEPRNNENQRREEQQQLELQHVREQQDLATHRAKEQDRLEQQHVQELRQAQNEQQEAIRQQQEAEHAAQDERWQKEEQAMRNRQNLERQRQLPPSRPNGRSFQPRHR